MGLDMHETKYLQVYDYYKDLILSGKMKESTKMPSIRRCATQLALSKTTIEMAYLCLAADGYIISKPQSGYYVAGRKKSSLPISPKLQTKKADILYNFTSNNVDKDSFDFELWKRYIKSALRQDARMLTYGEPQGEYELRETICDYVIGKRNAVCTPEQIVIGAGSQSLLNILCPLLFDKKSVSFQDTKFDQGTVIFQDYGFDILAANEEADIYYMTPSNMTSLGDVMNVEQRLALVNEATSKHKIIIEDDYNNEFRYFTKPRPCLQGLAGGENVIYLSTFSKLLLPSIRLSFMILPPSLLPAYYQKKHRYNQTASKAEQLALCQFLRNGNLDSQIRKLKRLYTAKTKQLMKDFEDIFGTDAECTVGESISILHVKLRCKLTNEEFVSLAYQHGIKVFPSPLEENDFVNIALSSCEVPIEQFRNAIILLKNLTNK